VIEDVDWEQVAHDMHRHFWPGSVAEVHGDPDRGDCYKCRRMGDWLRDRVQPEVIEVEVMAGGQTLNTRGDAP
jgi:hypothetical protein